MCEEERPEGVDLEGTGESVLRDRLERVLGSGYEDAFKYVVQGAGVNGGAMWRKQTRKLTCDVEENIERLVTEFLSKS